MTVSGVVSNSAWRDALTQLDASGLATVAFDSDGAVRIDVGVETVVDLRRATSRDLRPTAMGHVADRLYYLAVANGLIADSRAAIDPRMALILGERWEVRP